MISKVWQHSVSVSFDIDLTMPDRDPDHWDMVDAIREAVENGKADLQNYEMNGTPQMVDAPRYDEET